MTVEGVTFIEEEVVKWKRKDFIDAHKRIFFQDREEMKREEMLADIYDRISRKNKGKPVEDESIGLKV